MSSHQGQGGKGRSAMEPLTADPHAASVIHLQADARFSVMQLQSFAFSYSSDTPCDVDPEVNGSDVLEGHRKPGG